jgi:tetracycline 7-halogenase / FADH2 O2-dependent halogenase
MIRDRGDVAILGAGFAGNLLAIILRQLGRSVLLIERGHHPRFAIGESSTPLANLILESLARTYDLPRLIPLAEYGPWQRAYPQVACGLKRGFTFFQHERGHSFTPRADRGNELLVAANPSAEASDTHWFREHVDHFFLREAQAAGTVYCDGTNITHIDRHGSDWILRGERDKESVELSAAFLVDATGPACPLARLFGIPTDPGKLLTNSWTVYSHFANVERFESIYRAADGDANAHPYPLDDAALHHVLNDGWMWVLRFNNGLTSAGPVWDGTKRPPTQGDPEAEWKTLLDTYPSLAAQFKRASVVRPLVRTGRLQRQARRAIGPGWILLPHAAYFLDPLFSAGNAHTLLGIERLARALRDHWGRPSLDAALANYERTLFREVAFLDRVIHGCYCVLGRFDLLVPYTMYYFAAAIHSEERRRRGEADGDEFLFSHDEAFRTAVWRAHADLQRLVREPPSHDSERFAQQVAQDIAPVNSTGLCNPARLNLYPYIECSA